MKKAIIILFGALFSFGGYTQPPKVYINLVSHNEDSYTQYLNNPTAYYQTRSKMINMAQLCADKGAKWHLGTDWILPVAVMEYDTGNVLNTSNNKNILRYLSEDRNVSVDAHSHESTYNYTDVAHLLDSINVNISPVMSGFLWNHDQNGHYWTDYQNPVPGDSFPGVTWQPDILWGAGTPGHVNDPDYIGVWRPKDTTTSGFFTHDPGNHLINYGQGCKMAYQYNSNIDSVLQPLKDMLNAIEQEALDSNKIYCTSIFFRESELVKPNFLPTTAALIDTLNSYVDAGMVEWMKIDTVVEKWKNEFANTGSIDSCNSWNVSGIGSLKTPGNFRLKVYPNPSGGTVMIEIPNIQKNTYLTILTLYGQKIYHNKITHQRNTVNLDLQPGVYPVKITGLKRTIKTDKIIITK